MKLSDCYVLYIYVKAVSEAFQQLWSQLSLAVLARACWLAVIALVAASPAVLKSLLVAVVRSPWEAVFSIGWTS